MNDLTCKAWTYVDAQYVAGTRAALLAKECDTSSLQANNCCVSGLKVAIASARVH